MKLTLSRAKELLATTTSDPHLIVHATNVRGLHRRHEALRGRNRAAAQGMTRKEHAMITDPNCAYCAEGAPLDAFGIKICELPASKLYLFSREYGGVFEMNPKRTFLEPAEYDELIAKIKAAL